MASAVKISPVPGLEAIIGTVTSIMDIVEVSCYLAPVLISSNCGTRTRGRNTTNKFVMTSALKLTNSLMLHMPRSRDMMRLIQIRA